MDAVRPTMRMMFVFLAAGLLSSPGPARSDDPLAVGWMESPPLIDGRLDERGWGEALALGGFASIAPDYGLPPTEATSVRLSHDASHLYIAVDCSDSSPDRIKASLARRDNVNNDDWICIEISPGQGGRTHYFFRVNPLGVQEDGIIDQHDREDASYDLAWRSEGRLHPEGYAVEMAIPLASLRLGRSPEALLGLAVRRNINRKSEILSYPDYRPEMGSRLARRCWLSLSGVATDRIVELIPAATFSSSSAHEEGSRRNLPDEREIGLTGKIGLTPGLVLGGTFQPDFSQVESDAPQLNVNLRQPLYYAEKRPFFLEGREDLVFGNRQGSWLPLVEIVNTRSIVDPRLGLRLAGSISEKNRISAMYAVDENPRLLAEREGRTDGEDARVSVLRYRRATAGDGYVGLFHTGRHEGGRRNLVHGVDGLMFLSGTDRFEYCLLRSDHRQGGLGDRTGWLGSVGYFRKTRRMTLELGYVDIDEDFRTDVGFLWRSGLRIVPIDLRLHTYPNRRLVQTFDLLYIAQHRQDRPTGLHEMNNWFGWEITMPRSTFMYGGYMWRNEIFAGRRLDRSNLGFGVSSQVFPWMRLAMDYRHGNGIHYDPDAPESAPRRGVDLDLSLQPAEKLSTGLTLLHERLERRDRPGHQFDYQLWRHRFTYQFHRTLFVRSIIEYDTHRRRLNTELLLSFTYVPDTVFFLGYGSTRQRLRWNGTEYLEADDWLETGSSIFLKASFALRN